MVSSTEERLKATFDKFGELLDERLLRHVYTTEDSIRYTFFHCLTSHAGINPVDIILEQPHPAIDGAKVDLYIPSLDDREGLSLRIQIRQGNPKWQEPAKNPKGRQTVCRRLQTSAF